MMIKRMKMERRYASDDNTNDKWLIKTNTLLLLKEKMREKRKKNRSRFVKIIAALMLFFSIIIITTGCSTSQNKLAALGGECYKFAASFNSYWGYQTKEEALQQLRKCDNEINKVVAW